MHWQQQSITEDYNKYYIVATVSHYQEKHIHHPRMYSYT